MKTKNITTEIKNNIGYILSWLLILSIGSGVVYKLYIDGWLFGMVFIVIAFLMSLLVTCAVVRISEGWK